MSIRRISPAKESAARHIESLGPIADSAIVSGQPRADFDLEKSVYEYREKILCTFERLFLHHFRGYRQRSAECRSAFSGRRSLQKESFELYRHTEPVAQV
ncbi:MAG: hypothetical protein RIA65_01020 [Woeseia sp.]